MIRQSQLGLRGAFWGLRCWTSTPRLWLSQNSGSLPLATRRNHLRVCAQSLSRVRLCGTPMDRSPPGSSVHGILQARILEWVAMPSSRGSSRPRDRTRTSLKSPALASGSFTTSAPWEALHEPHPAACIRISGGGAGHRRCFRVPDDVNKYAGLGSTTPSQGKGWWTLKLCPPTLDGGPWWSQHPPLGQCPAPLPRSLQ